MPDLALTVSSGNCQNKKINYPVKSSKSCPKNKKIRFSALQISLL
jgi:hypothetical protein